MSEFERDSYWVDNKGKKHKFTDMKTAKGWKPVNPNPAFSSRKLANEFDNWASSMRTRRRK